MRFARSPKFRPSASAAGITVFVTAFLVVTACERHGAVATINSPDNGAHYMTGDSIWFQGEVGSDLGQPLGIAVEGDWVWTSDLDGPLGDRAVFRRNDLSIGEHLIILRVRNDAGIVLRDQVRIFVDPARR